MALKTSQGATASRYKVVGATAGACLLCVSIVAPFEGLWTTAKPDTLAHGIPTVCYGETENVKLGDTYTKAQCQDMLAKKLPRYINSALSCITVDVSDKQLAAYGSLTYNIGERAFCHSSVATKLNMGDPFGSCDAMLLWTHAGGKYVKGLDNRRHSERKLCLEGIHDKAPVVFTAKPTLPVNHTPAIIAPKPPKPWYVRLWIWLLQ